MDKYMYNLAVAPTLAIVFQMSKQQISKQSKKHFVKIHISNPKLSDYVVNYIELDAPADPNNWIDIIYLARIGLRGTFFLKN